MAVRADYSSTPPGGGRLTTKFYSVDAYEHAVLLNALEAANRSVGTTTSTATPSIDSALYDVYVITALAVAITSITVSNAVNGRRLIIRIKDNGTSRAITLGSSFRAVGVTLPTATAVSKTTYIGCIYNSADAKWDVIAVAQEA